MLTITDLFDSRDVVNLQESETKNIIGGRLGGEACSPRGAIYVEADGDVYECQDGFLWSRDEWVHIS